MPLISNIFKSLKRPQSVYGVLFDTSKLTLVLFKEGKVSCSVQENISSRVLSQYELNSNIKDFSQALLTCIERCNQQENNKINVKDMVWGVGGVGVASSAVSVRHKKSSAFKITKRFLLDIYKQIDQASLNLALQSYYQSMGNDMPKIQNIFVETTDIKLDGQTFFNPIGQSASVLELEAFNSYALKSFVDFLLDISKEAGLNVKDIAPVQYLVVKKLKQKMGSLFDATIINLYSSFTDISVVFGGKLVRTITLPLGSLDIDKDLDLWMEGLEIAMLNMGGIKTFSHLVYICGDAPTNTEFWEMLEWKEWEERVPFKTRPVFTRLDASYFDLPYDLSGLFLTCGLLSICKE